jgi:hypothetical protein
MIGVDFSGSFEEMADKSEPARGNGHDTGDAPWPVIDPAAFHGLAGEVVARILPNTESDPVALLVQFLAYFGNAVGRGPHYQIERTQHFANLFAVLAGQTSKSRKGTSAERIRAIFKIADSDWARERTKGGMSSGEGVISAVRDPVYATRKGVEELVDAGVSDKRLLLDEREFAGALTVLKREGNILSRIVRDAWDCNEMLQTMTKHSPTRATHAFISIVGHITVEELRRALDQTSMANGYANRFLFACVRRSKLLPHGGAPDDDAYGLLGAQTLEALTAARAIDHITMTAAAARHWIEVYEALAQGAPGLLGAITDRAEAQTTRLALIYALLDRVPQIDVVHIDAALALWRYCAASARTIFGDIIGDPNADAILSALRAAGADGLSRTDLSNLFGRNLPANKISAALVALMSAGKVRRGGMKKTGGRFAEIWFAVTQ